MEGTLESLMPQLCNGKLDVVVGIMTTDTIEPLIGHQVLKVERYHVFVRVGHPLDGRTRVPLAELGDYPWITGADEDRAMDEVRASFEALGLRSEEHTSELQSLMRISYAVFCLKKKT